jgi:hypothetical protein
MRALRSSCGFLLAAFALAQSQSEPASVEGTVVNVLTGVPVPRARVTLKGQGRSAKSYGALTSAEGKFSIAEVAPGLYEASAERVGFFIPADPGGRSAVDVVVRPGLTKEDLKLRLAPLGSISGRVVAPDGEPVEGAAVSIETGPVTSTLRDSTDDEGRFRLLGLLPGKYRVRAVVSPVALLSARPEIRTDGTVETRYAPTYFGGVTDFKTATRIEVGTGADISGAEIRLLRIPMVRVSGKVLGLPPDARGVNLRYSQIYGARPGSGTVKKDGSFELCSVDPGKYFLSGSWSNAGQPFQTAPVNIAIGDSNVDDVELRVVPPSHLPGRIVFEDEQARPPENGPKPRLEVRTVDPISAGPALSDVSPDGLFELTEVPAARYRVMLSWTTAYVKAVILGSNQVDGNVLYLRNGSAGAPLTVLLSSAFGSITGTVYYGDTPVAGARVALLRDDFVSLGDVTFVVTNESGSYSIPNVRPGKYRIAAIDENDDGPRAGNMDDYEDILVRLDVQPKDRLTKSLKRHAPVK